MFIQSLTQIILLDKCCMLKSCSPLNRLKKILPTAARTTTLSNIVAIVISNFTPSLFYLMGLRTCYGSLCIVVCASIRFALVHNGTSTNMGTRARATNMRLLKGACTKMVQNWISYHAVPVLAAPICSNPSVRLQKSLHPAQWCTLPGKIMFVAVTQHAVTHIFVMITHLMFSGLAIITLQCIIHFI